MDGRRRRKKERSRRIDLKGDKRLRRLREEGEREVRKGQ